MDVANKRVDIACECAQETITAYLMARDGTMAAVCMPPALLSTPLQMLATGTSTALLTAAPVDLSACVSRDDSPVLIGCIGCSMEYLPSMGLLIVSLRTMGSEKNAWLFSGRPVSGPNFLSDITASKQLLIGVRTPSTTTRKRCH